MDANLSKPAATTYVADRALLPGGWTDHAVLEVLEDGTFGVVRDGTAGADATRIAGVVVPGVPNVHSHAFQRGLAGRAEKGDAVVDDFWGWRSVMYRFLHQLAPEDVEALAAQLYVEMLESGYTAVAEFHYLHRDQSGVAYADPLEMSRRIINAAEAAGIRTTLLPTVYMRAGFDDGLLEGGQKRFRMDPVSVVESIAELEGSHAGPLLHLGLGLHSLRAVGLGDIRRAIAGLSSLGTTSGQVARPIHMHVAEQTGEVRAALRWVGGRPVDYLLDHVDVDAQWCLIHATHLTESELRRLASSGATVGLCPTTEANLGDGLFRIPDYQLASGSWAVGSDSQISVSPVAELRMLEYGQRLRLRARNVSSQNGGGGRSTGRALLDQAWAGGARALGQRIGAIATGHGADLVVLDPDHPALVGLESDGLLDGWVFSGERSPVRRVMVGGRWRVDDGQHARRAEILDRFNATMKRLSRTA